MAPAIITVTFYNEENEVEKAYARSIIPFGILKQAIKLANTIDPNKMTEDDVDKLASLVVAAFDDKFTVDDLEKKVDIGEMMTVLNTILTRANTLFAAKPANPTTQA